ncbi:MAG: YkgJ family cysteine cluster protein [Synergistaceae bacterium]|jgi:Fe-S-cluster containining protein|nr:YkgJ family cysteine cluster protein [Synergistaceae bacterium]
MLPWWGKGLYFSCVKCGACCGRAPGTVRFTRTELASMSGALGMSHGEFVRRYTWKKYGVLSIREHSNYDCVFLQISECGVGCKIYPVRPLQCSSFPFWPDILENELSWNKFSLSCPGMNNGKYHDFDEISKYVIQYIHDGILKFL